MDNIWIVLLIVGAVISLTQKSQKRRPQQEPEDEEPARELCKQFEEMFGRREEYPAAPRPTATPMAPKAAPEKMTAQQPAAAPATTASGHPKQKRAPLQSTAAAEKASHATPHRKEGAQPKARRQQPNEQTPLTVQQNRKMAPAAATAQHGNNDLEKILEEFDMERAVIYSEILKPKFEEY